MKTAAKIAIGVGVAAVAAAIIYKIRKGKANSFMQVNKTTGEITPIYNTENQQAETALPNQQQAPALPVQIPGSPILTTAPVYAPVDYSRATMIKRNFVEENLQGLKGLSYLLR